INCNGGVAYIMPNLRDALRQVRLPDRPRRLWVDSICINQANPQEQGRQVSLMGLIY
ncbi:HET-domain-containing protein, partial [Canariomyces notabilis]